MTAGGNRVLKSKNPNRHEVIYNCQIRKLKNLDNKIQK